MPSHRAAKRPRGGPAREPLTYLLGTRAKVDCLRVLAAAGAPVSQREVARRAGVQHRTAQLALDELVALGFLRRIEGGREFLVALDERHRLAPALRDLFQSEAVQFLELRRGLAGMAPGRGVLAAALFGSVARGDDTADSDLDVLLIATDETACSKALEGFAPGAQELEVTFGRRVRPIAYPLAKARRLWRQRKPPIAEAVRDGLVLRGPALRELLGD